MVSGKGTRVDAEPFTTGKRAMRPQTPTELAELVGSDVAAQARFWGTDPEEGHHFERLSRGEGCGCTG
jgi:hypothetical protein